MGPLPTTDQGHILVVTDVCPNPLFVQWLEEWRDEAREGGSKSQYTYTKALNSLKKYPLPLYGGKEAKILDHIGEKLAKMLDKKLTQHQAFEGEPPSAESVERKMNSMLLQLIRRGLLLESLYHRH